jgi:hypothetical protein
MAGRKVGQICTDNAEVAGSIPASPTTIFVHVRGNFFVFPTTGDGPLEDAHRASERRRVGLTGTDTGSDTP